MRRLRHFSVWILLATLVAGGVLAPPLHDLQHAAERAALSTDEPCHTSAVHDAEVPLVTEQGDRVEAPDCELCARRLVVVQPVFGPIAIPILRRTIQSEVWSHLASAQTVTDRFIRGPPRLLGTRLA